MLLPLDQALEITDSNKKSGYYNFNILENNQYINKLTGLMKYYLII